MKYVICHTIGNSVAGDVSGHRLSLLRTFTASKELSIEHLRNRGVHELTSSFGRPYLRLFSILPTTASSDTDFLNHAGFVVLYVNIDVGIVTLIIFFMRNSRRILSQYLILEQVGRFATMSLSFFLILQEHTLLLTLHLLKEPPCLFHFILEFYLLICRFE